MEDTIDYARVVERVREELARGKYALVEAAAERTAQLLLSEFAAAHARVSVAKVGLIAGVARLGAAIERSATVPAVWQSENSVQAAARGALFNARGQFRPNM